MPMKPSRGSRGALAALLVAASVALSGCGILGCGGGAPKPPAGGGGFGGLGFCNFWPSRARPGQDIIKKKQPTKIEK
ncbi:hypothetical protein, partial [Burkholderia ambifaria]|uniref:hypothetical protein n=1 Tax=Burkholderia ambifaria TaxID=152480 RepID=UPI003C7D9C1C